MISIERSFYSRFPALAQGSGRRFSQPVVSLLRRVTCESRMNDVLHQLGDSRGLEFVANALQRLRFSYRMTRADIDNIPAEGPLLIVANHPLGALDALALLDMVGSVRPDVRILANDVLAQLQPLDALLLPCTVFGPQATSSGLRETYRALQREQAVIVFPAGEVSRIGPVGVRDRHWSTGFVRFARKTSAMVLPVHVAAHNSPAFYGLSMLAKPLSALMLPRELFAAQDSRITISVGEPIEHDALGGEDEVRVAAMMRRHVYRLPRQRPPLFATTRTIARAEPVHAVRRSLSAAEALGSTTDGKRILLLQPEPGCAAMREIGRLRELAFRRVGEGSGGKRDLDRFDATYRHIVLWDEQALEIVGAYRLGDAGRIMRTQGADGLYTSTLFDFDTRADGFLADAVELGRSFVQPRYWGTRSLDYLWQGIGAYLRRHPQLRYLFGPVSLSARLPTPARDWIVAFHQHYFADPDRLATARQPYRVQADIAREAGDMFTGMELRDGTKMLRQRLQALDASLPTLYRQYPDLCEPDGVRFLDFGIDAAFGHCVDGLIRLDLHRLKPAKRARYLGDAITTDALTSAESAQALQVVSHVH